jgi:hypothetical protein
MNGDPASMAMQQKTILEQEKDFAMKAKSNELNIFETRIVPGDYTLLMDRKFQAFG